MRAQRALRERDQRARQDVGTLDGDADRNHLVGGLQVVARTVADGTAAVNVEGIVDGAAHALRRLVFHERGNDRRALTARHHRGGHGARRLARVGRLDLPRQRLFDTFHARHRQAELLADAPVGARQAQHGLGAGGGARRQRDGAAGSEAFHQHAPALAGHGFSADHPIHRNDDVAPPVGTVGEGSARRQMPAADLHARMRRGDHGDGDAHVLALAEDVVRIKQTEGEAEQRRLGPERDVALVPRQADAPACRRRHG